MHFPAEDLSLNEKFKDSRNCIIRGDCLKAMEKMGSDYNEKIKMIFTELPNDRDARTLDEIPEDKKSRKEWFALMSPILKISKSFLKDDGLIMITTTEKNIAQLKLLMDYVYGSNNFLFNLAWRTSKRGANQAMKYVCRMHEYILCYAKNKRKIDKLRFGYSDEQLSLYQYEDDNGPYYWKAKTNVNGTDKVIEYNGKRCIVKRTKTSENGILHALETGEGYLKKIDPEKDEYIFMLKQRMRGGVALPSIFDSGVRSYREEGNRELRTIFDGFFPASNAQPTFLISYFAKTIVDSDEIVLDFFAGTGTTGHGIWKTNVADKKNRNFILIQREDKLICDSSVEKYLNANGIKKDMFSLMKERLIRASDDIRRNVPDVILKKIDLGFKSYFLE